jgi:hypothetical protein
MAKLGSRAFTKNAKIGISLIVVAVVAVASIVTAAIVLPRVAPDAEPQITEIAAIVADNEGIISVDADLTKVFATVKYKDGSEKKVALSELIIAGLDTSDPGTLNNVILDYGGFKQAIKYEVVPTLLDLEYVASTGGRIEGDTFQQVPAGGDASRVQAIPDEGYKFVKWSDTNPNASRLDKEVSSSQRIIAVFEKRRYAVVFFYPDGTTAREEIVAYNESPTRIPRANETNMRLYGYKFVGFDKDYSKITDNTDIYPLYEKYATDTFIEYTLDSEGVALGTSDAIPFYEKDQVATIRVLANPDRLFVGWSVKTIDGIWVNLEPEDEQRLIKVGVDHNIQFRTSQTGTSEEYALNFTPDSAVEELYIRAHFVYIESQISFTTMSVKAREPFTIRYDEEIGTYFDVENLSYLSMLGYEFKGWAVSNGELDEFGNPVIIDNTYTFSQPTELVAQWEKKVYDVIFLQGQNENTAFLDEQMGYDPSVGGRVLKAYYQDSLAGALEGAFPEEPVILTNHTFKGWFVRGEDMLPTSQPVDKTYKIDREVTYVVPVFEVNKVNLNVSIAEGSGTIVNLESDPENPELGDTEVAIRGQFKMAVNAEYRFRIKAASGYRLVQVNIGGVVIDMPPDQGDYDFSINSPDQDKTVIARFRMARYNIQVNNGSAGTEGTIVYNDVDEAETGYISSDQTTVVFSANYGASKNIEINAQDGNYIMSVVADGVSQSVPYLATYYTVRLSGVSRNMVINITYRDFRYEVTLPLPEEIDNGTLTLLDPQIDYPKNSNPRIEVQADAGYYLRAIKVNGWTIDPYQPITGFSTSLIEVLGDGYEEGDILDPRVTYMILTIDAIKGDALVEVIFEQIYFNIEVTTEGNGWADNSGTVLYGGNYDIKAETSEGYYISAIEVDGVAQSLVGLRTSIVHTLTGVEKDFTVNFVFTSRRIAVSFAPVSGASVTFKNISYSISAGKTFTGLSVGSNNTFSINAGTGNQIDSVEYYSGSDPLTIISEDIAFSATTHVLQLDNISSDFVVTVTTKPLLSYYTIYVENKLNSDVIANGYNIGSATVYDDSLVYGENLTIEVIPFVGLAFSIEDVFVRNVDPSNSYSYTQTEYLNENIDGGQYFLDESPSYTYLIVARVRTDIDIFITFADAPPSYDVKLVEPDNGTLSATAEIGGVSTDIDESTDVPEGTSLTFEMVPSTGYMLLAMIINGERISSGISDGVYLTTMPAGALLVSAIFIPNRFSVNIDNSDSNGVITSETKIFSEGESFKIKASARKGYTVKTMSITVGYLGTIHSIDVGTDNQVFVYDVPVEYTVDNLYILAAFQPDSFSLSLDMEGNGTLSQEIGIKDVNYGDSFALFINADDFHFIESIIINGVSFSPFDLTDRVDNYDLDVTESGTLSMEITSDTTIFVNFLPNEYSITYVPDLNGETLFKKVTPGGVSSQFVDYTELLCNSGDTLWLKMTANPGYHISGLIVNGIDDTGWRVGNIRDNDLTEVFYELMTISSNVRIQVLYEVNVYSMKVNATNTSVNYKDFDKTPQDFGRVTIVGFLPDANNEYTGFAHGSNIRVFIQPRTARGYEINRFSIKYSDGTEVVISDVDMPKNGGSYTIYNLTNDIDELKVEFRRKLFTFAMELSVNQLGSGYSNVEERNYKAQFTNPYSSTAQIVLVDGIYYEYGTTFEIFLFPETGYSRTQFLFNGEDRRAYVRSNKYTGVITSNILAQTEFTINTYNIIMEQNVGGTVKIRDEANNILWSPNIIILQPGDSQPSSGEFVNSEVTTTRGHIWVYEDKLVVTYDTFVRLFAIPNNYTNGVSTEGYRVSSFIINSVSISVSGDVAGSSDYSTRTNISARATFSINRYSVDIAQFEGGSASASPSDVTWDNSSAISVTLSKGYYISSVKINGIENDTMRTALSSTRTYLLTNIRETKNIVILLERNRYDVLFDPTGDYKKSFSINNGERIINAVSWAGLNENVPMQTPQFFRSTDGTILETGYIKSSNLAGDYIGLRYGDKLIFHLTVPNGFEIESISVKMDDEGYSEAEILNSEAGLDADDGTGTRTFTIANVTGNVEIYVKYRIKTYAVVYVLAANGEFVDMNTTSVAHHEKVTWEILADYGYYLSQLEINGISYSVSSNTLTYSKVDSAEGKLYRYSTDTRNIQDEVVQKEISDSLLNGNKTVRIIPYFAPLYYNVAIQINNRLTNDNLQVTINNSRIMYDPSVRAIFNHDLDEGFSIKGIEFRNSDAFDYLSYILTENDDEILDEDEYNPKDASLSLPAYGQLLDIMDFHSSYQKIIRVFYLVEKDKHLCDFDFHLIESELDGTGLNYVNKGNSFADDGLIPKIEGVTPAFATSREFTDNIAPSAPHDYGVYGLFNSAVDPIAQSQYEFSGYQENVNGVWSYVTSSTPNIELLSGGRTMRVNLKQDRQFRAVYFRLYKVSIEVHPEFKYVQGSFATSEPELMNYRLYSRVFASAQHYQDPANGVVLPNIVNSYVDLIDVNTENLDGKYEFLVRSGALIKLTTIDSSPTVNPSRSYVYYDIEKTSYSYSQGAGNVEYDKGVSILQDKLVYSYARNNVYLSFAMETEGSLQSNAGGTITYLVNGSPSALVNNSLLISPDSTVEVTIKPNSNYRFDSISSLGYMARASEDGYRRSTGVFSPVVTSLDNQITVTYYDVANNPVNPATYMGRIATVRVLMKNVAENAIFKVKFWKQIEFTRTLTIMTDEGVSTNSVYLKPSFITPTNANGTYNFGDYVTLKLNLPTPAYSGWNVRWQFVGFFVNGVNLFKNLAQSYPSQIEVVVRLDDSAQIKDKIVDNRTVFAVDIVARFIPVYNVVIENEYKYDPLDSPDDIYLDPEYITYEVVPYREQTMRYTRESGIINSKQGALDHNELSFKMMGKINTLSGVKENPTSGYNTWANNEITLNWAGAALAGPTYKFLGWQYYKYETSTQSFGWANIPYVKELGGTLGTMDYKRVSYTFPISSLVSSSYYSIFNTSGFIDNSSAKTSIWTYNAGTGLWEETTEVPAIRIRPLFQKVVPVEILKEGASEQEGVYTAQGAAGIRPVIVENSLSSASFEYYKTVVLDAGLRQGYEFNGWYLVVNDVYFPLDDENPLALKQVGLTDVYMSYKYTDTTKRLDIRLDWLVGTYSVVARYTRIFNITMEVVSASGSAPYIVNALPNISFYGLATKVGEVWSDPASPTMTQRKITYTARVGNRLVFKLATGYNPANPNDWTKFNPRFDKIERIEDLETTLGTDMWITGDSIISSGVVFGESDPTEIESATYRIAANGDKYIKIFIRSEADLVIHNVYYNSFVRMPDALAVAKGWKTQGSIDKIYVKDNGPNDSDATLGIIMIENIPIQASVNYDGISAGDFGNRISPYLSPNAILSSEIYQRGINLNGNTITSKLAQFSYYGDKENVLTGYDIAGDPVYSTLESPLTEYPFDGGDTEGAGDGTEAKPFRIATIRQLQNIDALYNGNIVGGAPTLRYATGGTTYSFNFILVADIDLYEDNIKLSTPLCSNGNGFDGILSGYKDATTNYALYDYHPSTGGDYRGLFARLNNNSIVRDIWLGNFSVSGGSASYVGAIAGYAGENTLIENIDTTDLSSFNPSTGRSCSGSMYVGGIVGYLDKGAIVNNCNFVSVQVQSQYSGWITDLNSIATFRPGGVGGLVGVISDTLSGSGQRARLINSISNKGTVIGIYAVGGIVGAVLSAQGLDQNPSIDTCQAVDPSFSETDSQGYIGGAVGFLGFNRQVENIVVSALTSDITIYSKWSTAAYTSPVEPNCLTFGGGGIVGINFGFMDSVSVDGSMKINLSGAISGGVAGINGGTITDSTVTVGLRTDRRRVGSAWRSGTFGGHVGYNRADSSIIGAVTNYVPATYGTVFAENSAAYTIYTEVGTATWADNFNIEIPVAPDPKTNPVIGDDPGSDTANLYLGGIVGYNRGIIISHYEDETLIRATSYNGKLLVSRRSNGTSSNYSYIGLIVGYNETSSNILDTATSINAKIEYYRYNFVGVKGYNLTAPYTYMYDFLGGLIGGRTGSGQATIPSVYTATAYARYEANGNGPADHDPVSGGFWGQSGATNFPVSRIDLTNEAFTSAITINNPLDFTINMDESSIYNHAYLNPNSANLAVWPDNAWEYYGKYRQTAVS